MIMDQPQTIHHIDVPSLYKKPAGGIWDRLHSPFPFYLNDDRKNLLMILVISAFVTVFLYAFPTANAGLTDEIQWIHGLITFFCLCINILLLPKMFPAAMDPVHWTYFKYILITTAHLILIVIITTFVEKYLFCPEMDWLVVGTHVMSQVALKGVIPIVLTTLFLKTRLLQDNLKEAIRINHELGKIQVLKKEQPKAINGNVITLFSDTTESLTFNLPDLLFIEADDNYSTVVWKDGNGVQKRLLRVNLKNLETQLNNSFTLRCHRSYIVNVNAISAISGNTNGYKLRINGGDFSIPVSRPKGKEVMDKISQLRNVMELS